MVFNSFMGEARCFKIRDRVTGLWSTGGVTPKFNKTGKTWSTIGHVKNHLLGYLKHARYCNRVHHAERMATVEIPESWEVVDFVVSTEEGGAKLARGMLGK